MIVLCVGELGVGKTGFTTARAIRRAQRTHGLLASNIKLVPPEGVPFVQLPVGPYGLDVAGLLRLRGQATALGCERIVLLVDEVGIVMDARFWAAVPASVKSFLAMSRKLKVDIYGTAHDVDDVEVSLRRRCSFTYQLSRVPSGGEDGDDRQPWFLVVRRWRRVEVGKKGAQLGLASFVRWRREWVRWFDTDELVEPPEAAVERDLVRERRRVQDRARRAPTVSLDGLEAAATGPP